MSAVVRPYGDTSGDGMVQRFHPADLAADKRR